MACPLCDDTGWKRIEESGRTRVARCDCWRANLASRALANARIPRRYLHCDFDNFVTYGNESLERAVAHARRLASAYPLADRGLFLLGPPGVGKTHLAVAFLKDIVRRLSARGVFYDTRELLRVIRQTYDPVVRASESDVLHPVIDADVLVLDDLGAEKTSEWVDETLNLIVNSRYSEKRLTVFTSNYEDKPDPSDPDSLLCRIGYRMRSRLHEMCEFLDLDGADYRELPANGGPDDLRALWNLRKKPTRKMLTARTPGSTRSQTASRPVDLKWSGGRAGS